MIQLIFRNIPQSELTQTVVVRRIDSLISKFSSMETARVLVTLEMENSPIQAGMDVFSVKLQVLSGPLRGIRIVKSSDTLHAALAEVIEDGFETLSRVNAKKRSRSRHQARKHQEMYRKTGS